MKNTPGSPVFQAPWMILLPDLARVELADDLAGLGMVQVVHLVGLDRGHEGVGDRDRDVEVGDLASCRPCR